MDGTVELIRESVPNQERANQLMGRLFAAAQPDAVFAEPVTQGAYTVITASELSIGMGYGFGGGGSLGAEPEKEGDDESEAAFGSGGGGGGGATARPVAAIEIGPNGVRVEPIVDPTKISIAFFTAIGSMFMMLLKMRRMAEER